MIQPSTYASLGVIVVLLGAIPLVPPHLLAAQVVALSVMAAIGLAGAAVVLCVGRDLLGWWRRR